MKNTQLELPIPEIKKKEGANPESGKIRGSYPEGFDIRDGWVVTMIKKDKKSSWEKVCTEIRVVGQSRDESSQGWAKLVEVIDPDGVKHTVTIPNSLFAPVTETDLLKLLLDKGLQLNHSGSFNPRIKLKQLLSSWNPNQRLRSVENVGWHHSSFVLPNFTNQSVSSEQLLLSDELGRQSRFNTKGSLKDWQEKIASKCSGNSRAVFSLSASFTPVMLKSLRIESGGFHFRGNSSLGKTTLLQIAGSVWGGGGVTGYLKSWRTTANALEQVARMHNDVLLCLDEIGQVDEKQIGQIVYMLSNQSGKGRMKASGELRNLHEWRVLFLSSGEISLEEAILQTSRKIKAGQEVRFIDIPADAGKGFGCWDYMPEDQSPAEFTKSLKDSTDEYYGLAGREFIRLIQRDHIIDNRAAFLRQEITQLADRFRPPNAAEQVQRVLRHFIEVGRCGELAVELGVLPLGSEEPMKAALQCFQGWLDQRDTAGNREHIDGLNQVREFLQRYGASRFSVLGEGFDPDGMKTMNRAGYIKFTDDSKQYLIFTQVFKSEVCRGFSVQAIAEELLRQGHLERGEGDNLAKKCRVEEQSMRFYTIRESLLCDDDENQSEQSEQSEHCVLDRAEQCL